MQKLLSTSDTWISKKKNRPNVKNDNENDNDKVQGSLSFTSSHVHLRISALPDSEVQFQLSVFRPYYHTSLTLFLANLNRHHPDLVQHLHTDDTHAAYLCSYHSDCFCRVLDEWPTSTSSRTKSSSGAEKVPFDWEPSFNAQHARMGDLCEVGTRIQFVRDLILRSHLMVFAQIPILFTLML